MNGHFRGWHAITGARDGTKASLMKAAGPHSPAWCILWLGAVKTSHPEDPQTYSNLLFPCMPPLIGHRAREAAARLINMHTCSLSGPFVRTADAPINSVLSFHSFSGWDNAFSLTQNIFDTQQILSQSLNKATLSRLNWREFFFSLFPEK